MSLVPIKRIKPTAYSSMYTTKVPNVLDLAVPLCSEHSPPAISSHRVYDLPLQLWPSPFMFIPKATLHLLVPRVRSVVDAIGKVSQVI